MPQKSEPSAERARAALLRGDEPSNDDLYALVCERLKKAQAERQEEEAPAPAPRSRLTRRRALAAAMERRRADRPGPRPAATEGRGATPEPRARRRSPPALSRLTVPAPHTAAMERRGRGRAVSSAALTVLGSMVIDGRTARIGAGQLDRKLYAEVNKALEALGGKWNRKAQGHVFEEDPRDALDRVVLTGEFSDKRQDFGFFETPAPLAARVVEMADIRPGMDVLEPSAGRGALVRAVQAAARSTLIGAVEIQPENARALHSLGVDVREADFLALPVTGQVDRVVMNPPFARQADIEHVCRAFAWLRPGGRLVSIMSAGVTFRQDRKTQAFQMLVRQNGGEIEELPPGSFAESGTGVPTVLVTLEKPGGAP